jgi:hypothetical protein
MVSIRGVFEIVREFWGKDWDRISLISSLALQESTGTGTGSLSIKVFYILRYPYGVAKVWK